MIVDTLVTVLGVGFCGGELILLHFLNGLHANGLSPRLDAIVYENSSSLLHHRKNSD